ncbi:MAG: hypothetical protein M3Y42_14010 [Actinomycetota bacterium]|nr:hypothetical protein [Actinomycetota bacterium]
MGALTQANPVLPVTKAYLAACQADPALLNVAARLEFPPEYERSFGAIQLPRPIFMDSDQLEQLGADLYTLHNLLVSLPERAFDGDLDRYCAAINLEPPLAEVMRLHPTGDVPVYGRADAFHDGRRFRLLEYNLGSELGGREVGQLNRSFLADPVFARFSVQHRLEYHDPMLSLVEIFRRQAAELGISDPVVGLVDGNGVLAGYEHLYTAVKEDLARHGIPVHIGEVRDVSFAGGKVRVHQHPIDLLLRFFTAPEISYDAESVATYKRLLDADDSGAIRMVWTLEGALFNSKATLGLLHDPAVASRLEASESELVERLLPWTRVLSPAGHPPADHAQVEARSLSDQSNLVIKPGIGIGGKGTVIGSDVTREVWLATLKQAVGTDWVVQERVRAQPEQVIDPTTDELQDWTANWGAFVDQDGYRGAFVRALQPAAGSIVAYANPGTRGACVFGVPPTGTDRADNNLERP